MQTLGIYVQVPFCASKCTFCNFSSRVAPESVFDAYCRAVESEIERLPALYRSAGIDAELLHLPVDTIYFGGGSPSLLGAERLAALTRAITGRFEAVSSNIRAQQDSARRGGRQNLAHGARVCVITRKPDVESITCKRPHSAKLLISGRRSQLSRRLASRGFAASRPHPGPLPLGGGEGVRRTGEGAFPQGLRPGLRYFASSGLNLAPVENRATNPRRATLPDTFEFTLELTPGSAGDALLVELLALGVNRLSIGAQSFNDRELACVGRLHSAADTVDQVLRARRAGYSNLGLDLIAGLPRQTQASWLESLRQAAILSPEHISVYLFEVDEMSRLGSEVLRHGDRYGADEIPDDDFMADAYEKARDLLAAEGFEQYEISNFARPGFESRHNRRYWRLEPYLGLGAGAHSFDGRRRWSNVVAPEAYEAKLQAHESPIAEVRSLSCREQIEEFFFLGLRQRDGVDLGWARRRWGATQLAPWAPRIAALERDGRLERDGEGLRMPSHSYLVSNEVSERFLI